MATYLVIKRMKEDRLFMPGETVVDIPRADILIHRGYIIPVPDDYAEKAAASADEAASRISVQQAMDMGYSEKAAKHIAARTDPLPKYVQEEKEKIDAREALRAQRTPAELDRLAIILKTTAEEVLDLPDDDYAAVLLENPSPAGNAASDPEEVEKGDAGDQPRPFETLMAMPKEGLLANMAEHSIPEPTANEKWFEDEALHQGVVREILTKAGYTGEALNPVPPPPEETETT